MGRSEGLENAIKVAIELTAGEDLATGLFGFLETIGLDVGAIGEDGSGRVTISHESEGRGQVEVGEGEIDPEHVNESVFVSGEKADERLSGAEGDLVAAGRGHHAGLEDEIIREEDDHGVRRPR